MDIRYHSNDSVKLFSDEKMYTGCMVLGARYRPGHRDHRTNQPRNVRPRDIHCNLLEVFKGLLHGASKCLAGWPDSIFK